MATNERSRMEDQRMGPDDEPRTDMNEDRVRGSADDEIRGIADEGEDEVGDEDLEEEDEANGSY